MPRCLDPLRDKQQDPVVCTCVRCGLEIVDLDEGEVCLECQKEKKEEEEDDERTN